VAGIAVGIELIHRQLKKPFAQRILRCAKRLQMPGALPPRKLAVAVNLQGFKVAYGNERNIVRLETFGGDIRELRPDRNGIRYLAVGTAFFLLQPALLVGVDFGCSARSRAFPLDVRSSR